MSYAIKQYEVLANMLETDLVTRENNRGYIIGRPKINGQFEGRRISITPKTILINDTEEWYHILEVGCQLPEGYTLVLKREGLRHQILKGFGLRDIQFGHKAFDDNFLIQSNDPELSKIILNEPLRNSLVRDMGFFGGYRIGKTGWVTKRIRNKTKKTKSAEEILDIDLILENQESVARKKEKEHHPEKLIKTVFSHDIGNEMKRKWMERLIKTTVLLAKNLELATSQDDV
ncbi:MAG: hypothetical protein AAF502_12235 [Bacteroidota bacterium]